MAVPHGSRAAATTALLVVPDADVPAPGTSLGTSFVSAGGPGRVVGVAGNVGGMPPPAMPVAGPGQLVVQPMPPAQQPQHQGQPPVQHQVQQNEPPQHQAPPPQQHQGQVQVQVMPAPQQPPVSAPPPQVPQQLPQQVPQPVPPQVQVPRLRASQRSRIRRARPEISRPTLSSRSQT